MTLVAKEDFESYALGTWPQVAGRYFSQSHTANLSRIQVVSSPVLEGTKAVRVECRDGDINVTGSGTNGERAELCCGHFGVEDSTPDGVIRYITFSVRFDTNFVPTPGTEWNAFSQLHQTGSGQVNSGQPPWFFTVASNGTTLKLRTYGGASGSANRHDYNLVPNFQRNHWYNFTYGARFAADNTGWLEIYVDDVLVVPRTNQPTRYANTGLYMLIGNYRQAANTNNTYTYFDRVIVGDTLADVLPGGTSGPPGLRHRYNYTSDPSVAICTVHNTDTTDHVTEQGATDARISSVSLGGVAWAKLTTVSGETNVAGSGTWNRADFIISSSRTGSALNQITTYAQRLMVRPGVDWNPPGGNGNTVGWGFHRQTGGYPGGVFWGTRIGSTADTSGVNDDTWNNSNIVSGIKPRGQVGNLIMEFFGGQWLDSSGNPVTDHTVTPNRLNAEQWRLFDPSWEGKVVELAWRIKWSANISESGVKFYKNINSGTGTPTNLTGSGWIELQYRLGSLNIADGTILWGNWTWYDGGTITFADGTKQIWSNGPEPNRHYRPTLFYYNDTATYDNPYWKGGHNYHPDNGQTSSVYVGDNRIADNFSDVQAQTPGTGPPPTPLILAPGNPYQIGEPSGGGTAGGWIPDTIDTKRGIEVLVPDDAGMVDTAYEFLHAIGTTSAPRQIVVYAMDGAGGTPGTLIGSSASMTIPVSATAGWKTYTFPNPINLQPFQGQNIFIGTINGGSTGAVETWGKSVPGVEWSRADSFSNGASDPWDGSVGTTSQLDSLLSIVLVYAPVAVPTDVFIGAPSPIFDFSTFTAEEVTGIPSPIFDFTTATEVVVVPPPAALEIPGFEIQDTEIDLEKIFIAESPPGLWPENIESVFGQIRHSLLAPLQDSADIVAALFPELFVATARVFLSRWEKQMGLPAGSTIYSSELRRFMLKTRLRKGPFTRAFRVSIIEALIRTTRGFSLEFSYYGIPLVEEGVPFFDDDEEELVLTYGLPIPPEGIVLDSGGADLEASYYIIENLGNFSYHVGIRQSFAPDMDILNRELRHITPSGISFTTALEP